MSVQITISSKINNKKKWIKKISNKTKFKQYISTCPVLQMKPVTGWTELKIVFKTQHHNEKTQRKA